MEKTKRIQEAIGRYDIGDEFKCLQNGEVSEITQLRNWRNTANSSTELWSDNVRSEERYNNALLYKDGVWATKITNKVELNYEIY